MKDRGTRGIEEATELRRHKGGEDARNETDIVRGMETMTGREDEGMRWKEEYRDDMKEGYRCMEAEGNRSEDNGKEILRRR